MRRKIIILMAVTCLSALAVSGCSSHGPSVGGVLTRALVGNPSMLNPLLSTDSASAQVNDYIFQGLVRYDENMALTGQLAESWEVSPDKLAWTFYLRQDVSWHDGQLFTARDVEFTFNTLAFAQDYSGSRVNDFTQLKEVQVLDDYTIRFILAAPWGNFLDSMRQGIIPRHIYDPSVAAGNDQVPVADMAKHPRNWKPVGTGPYVYSSWVNNHSLTLERNEFYYGDVPFIQTVRFMFYPNTAAAIAGLEAGEADLVADIPCTEARRLEDDYAESHSFYGYQELGYEFLGFNFRPNAFGAGRTNPWLDRRVRQAVAHALNREKYIQEILSGHGVLMDSPIPPASWAYAPDAITSYAYDPEMAKQLLTEAGWKLGADGRRYRDGQRFTFQLTVRRDNALEMTMADMIRVDLEEVGIEMELNAVQWSEMLVDHVYSGDFHMLLMGLSLTPDPDVYNIFHSAAAREGLNFGAYSNSDLDIALNLGRQAYAAETRKDLYADAQRILTEDLPFVFLLSRELTASARREIQGIVSSPLGLCRPELWYIDENQ